MSRNTTDDGYRLDGIDRRIIYELMVDARNTSAPAIADEVGVSGATIRNRIARLEEHGILRGYQTAVDFERASGSLTNLFICHVAFGEIEWVAHQAGSVAGVINVRELMGGRMNLHVLAVGEDTGDLRRIGRQLSNLGAEIEDELLLQDEHHHPYMPYGPGDRHHREPFADSIRLTGGAEIVELTVHEKAPIAGRTLEDAAQDALLHEELLVIAIERGDRVLTPRGHTEICPNDVVTIFTPENTVEPALAMFAEPTGEGEEKPTTRG